jgi:hypothetical protein
MSNLALQLQDVANLTKSELEIIASQAVYGVIEGQNNPVAVIAVLKKYEKIIELVTKDKDFKDALINELSRSGGKQGYGNVEVQYSQTSRADYSNDPTWCELTAKVKEREAFLKGLPYEGMTVVDEVTGEVSKVYPPAKKSSDVIKAIYK